AKYERSPKAAIKYTTRYSTAKAAQMFESWSELDKYLLTKYIDGNIKAEVSERKFKDNGHDATIPGDIIFEGYGEAWKRAVAASDNGTLRVPDNK
ncbi:MAG: dipeptidase, partial [Rikenellaceae bacterium]|nr:dipeptidase [Rikenellaceae bacterium]